MLLIYTQICDKHGVTQVTLRYTIVCLQSPACNVTRDEWRQWGGHDISEDGGVAGGGRVLRGAVPGGVSGVRGHDDGGGERS